MKLRDFIFIQPPGQDWQQVNGSTERWVATVKYNALPGETKVGLGPWYTYADYLRFVNALRMHPHLEKRLAGRSDRGREHWELTITDPTVSLDQKQISWRLPPQLAVVGAPSVCASKASSIFSAMTLPCGPS